MLVYASLLSASISSFDPTLVPAPTVRCRTGFVFVESMRSDFLLMNRLLTYLSTSDAQLTAAPATSELVLAFMPSPQALVEMDRKPFFQ